LGFVSKFDPVTTNYFDLEKPGPEQSGLFLFVLGNDFFCERGDVKRFFFPAAVVLVCCERFFAEILKKNEKKA
jgi:hypothetical protein